MEEIPLLLRLPGKGTIMEGIERSARRRLRDGKQET